MPARWGAGFRHHQKWMEDYRQAGSLSDQALSDTLRQSQEAVSSLKPTASLFWFVDFVEADCRSCYTVFARCRSSRRSFNLPLCNCDFEVPALQPSSLAIS